MTPNGYADAVNNGLFVMPEERQMTVGQFLDILEAPGSTPGVFYVQKQNSNLTEEFQSVMGDVETEPAWATEVFGEPALYHLLQAVAQSSSFVASWIKSERADIAVLSRYSVVTHQGNQLTCNSLGNLRPWSLVCLLTVYSGICTHEPISAKAKQQLCWE